MYQVPGTEPSALYISLSLHNNDEFELSIVIILF